MVSFTRVAAIVAAASLVSANITYSAMTAEGCYHSSLGLTFNDTYTFQASGWCQKRCVPADYAVLATTAKSDCWCGNVMPPLNAKVDTSYCNATCSGYGYEDCGSADGTYFTVWLSGLTSSASNYDPSTSSEDSSSKTSASPSVVTVGGQTHTITAAASTDAATSSSGPNKAAIAGGVVVAILVIAGLGGAGYFFWRRKRQQEEEDEKKRQAAIQQFVQGTAPGSSSGMSSTDSRLDPTIASRRFSDGSIADNQDYSRRILKVTNA